MFSLGDIPALHRFGFAVHPDVWKLKNTVALDFRNINREQSLLSKFHFGVETETPYRVSARVGVNQGYISAGATIDLWVLKIEGAVYYQEVGTKNTQKGDFRYIVNFRFGV